MSQISTSDIRKTELDMEIILSEDDTTIYVKLTGFENNADADQYACLLYTSPSPRDVEESRMPSSA